jgi:hypothetical protein
MSTPDNLATPFQKYDLSKGQFSYMKPQGPHMPLTERYVAIPPALWIRDEEGALWTLGFDYNEVEWRSGRYEYDVVRNGVKTGEFARVIEYRVNSRGTKVVRIFGSEGWKNWNGTSFI